MPPVGPIGTSGTSLIKQEDQSASPLRRQLSSSQMRRKISAGVVQSPFAHEAIKRLHTMFDDDLRNLLGFIDQCAPDADCLSHAILAGGALEGDLQILHASNPQLCARHMRAFCRLSSQHLRFLLPYTIELSSWVDSNINLLTHPVIANSQRVLNYLFGLTLENPHLTESILKGLIAHGRLDLESMGIELKEPTALMYLNYRDQRQSLQWGEQSVHRALNPLLAKIAPKAWRQARSAESVSGVSRSTLSPSTNFDSALVQMFRDRQRILPLATFGPEYEVYFPGASGTHEIAFKEIKALFPGDMFELVDDASLETDVPIASPLELVFRILQTPSDIESFQGVLARLNDMGVFSNDTSGVHIHFGVKQWTTRTLGLEQNEIMAKLDTPCLAEGITPLQLAFAKQLVLNLASVQHEFYQVSRWSVFSKPIAADDPNQYSTPEAMNALAKTVNTSRSLRALTELVGEDYDAQKRYRVLNLQAAFDKHGTFELRGFSKVFADHMDVDPNLPVRDMVFLQDLIRISLNDVKAVLVQGGIKGVHSELRPNPAMMSIASDYVQDTLRLATLHALSQRGQGQRIMTMNALIELQPLFSQQTLARLATETPGMQHWANDRLASHFLNALREGPLSWKPTPFTVDVPLSRSKSLRSMADEHLKGHGGGTA